MNNTSPQPDLQALALTKAIRQHESQGNYSASGDNGTSTGAYQFQPATWQNYAKQVLGDANAQMSPENQNAVAYGMIKTWKDQGLGPAQIAAKWNSGSETGWENKVGTTVRNGQSLSYNVPQYVQSVVSNFKQIYPQVQSQYGQQQNTFNTGTSQPQDPHSGVLGTNPNDSFYGKLIDNSITRGIENVFPGKQIGEGVGNTLQGLYQGAQTHSMAPINEAAQQNNANAPRIFADAANAGLMAATPGAGEGAGLAARIGAQAAVGAGANALGSIANGETNVGNIAHSAMTGGLIGGAFGVGAEALGAAANKFAKPFAQEFQSGVASSADRIGLGSSELPISAMTNSKTTKYMESLFNGEKLAAQVENAQTKLASIADETIRSTGASEDLVQAGEQISKGLTSFTKTYKAATNKLYDDFAEAGGKAVTSVPVKTLDILNTIIDEKAAIGERAGSKYFQDKLDVIDSQGKSLPTFDVLKKMRTAVGEKLDGVRTDAYVATNHAQFKRLYGALSEDMDNAIRMSGNTKLSQSLDAANAAYKNGQRLFNTEYAKTITRFAKSGQYDKILPALISPTKSVANIPAMLEVIGPENLPNLRGALLSDIFEKSQSVTGGFTPAGVSKMLSKYGEERLNMILAPEQVQFLKDLEVVSKAIGEATKLSRGSQTAFLEKNMAKIFLGASALKNFFTGNVGGAMSNLAPILGGAAAEKFLNSGLGRKILTTGIEIGDVKGAAFTASKMANFEANK